MQPDPVHLGGSDRPPARGGGADDDLGNQIRPDERLSMSGNQEVLFGFSQGVGQADERSHQAAASVGRPAVGIDFRGSPTSGPAFRPDEIVAAHEQRIGIKNLSARRGIVGVIEGHQRIAQERRQFAALLFELFRIPAGFLQGRADVELAFHVHVLLRRVTEARGVLFGGAQGGPRRGNLVDPGGQTIDQRGIELAAAWKAFDVIGQLKQGIERDHVLSLEDAADLPRGFLARIGILRFGAGQQVHHALLGPVGGYISNQKFKTVAARIEQFAIVADSRRTNRRSSGKARRPSVRPRCSAGRISATNR